MGKSIIWRLHDIQLAVFYDMLEFFSTQFKELGLTHNQEIMTRQNLTNHNLCPFVVNN